MVRTAMDEDKQKNNVGGKATVFLLMPSNTPSDSDKSYIRDRKEMHKSHLTGKF